MKQQQLRPPLVEAYQMVQRIHYLGMLASQNNYDLFVW